MTRDNRMRARTLAQVYRRFGEAESETSPLYTRMTTALSESEGGLRAIEALPSRSRRPAVILAALHDLVLQGRAPELAAAYAAADAEAAAEAALAVLRRLTGQVAALAVRRKPLTSQTAGCAVLRPAVAEAARRLDAEAVGLIDLGGPVGLNLQVDRVGIDYDDGRSLGAASSPVRLSASIVGNRPVPANPLPEVVSRIGVGLDPVDLTDPWEARWLRACLPPDQPDKAATLEAELAVAAADAAQLLPGDPVESLPDAIARVPEGALPVVTTTWALSGLSRQDRWRFLHRLDEAASGRRLAWVSAEGVGVAPAIPTLGDRHASGHSIIGLALLGAATFHAEAVGRCWSRGRMLAWLADS